MADELILFLASFLIWLMFAGLVLLWFVDGKIKKEEVIHALLAIFVTFTLSQILKQLFHTPRPYLVDGLSTMTLTVPNGFSFPSDHSAIAFALAVTIWLHDRKVGIIFIILAFCVAWARVAANVHWPVDVVGGGMLGTLVALVIEKVHLRS